VSFWAKWKTGRTRELWQRALREHSSPREIGWSLAIGVFSGCTPFLGLHMWIALALATVFRKNRLWAFVGSRVSSSLVFVGIAIASIELGHRLRSGVWLPLAPREALAHARGFLFAVGRWLVHGGRQSLDPSESSSHDVAYFVDWLVGAFVVGCALAATIGQAGYRIARRRESQRRPA